MALKQSMALVARTRLQPGLIGLTGCSLRDRLKAAAKASHAIDHPDLGRQYFVKISLSAALVRSTSPRSLMEFLLSLSIVGSRSNLCSTIVPSPSNEILSFFSSIITESGLISFK
jgi:hypothetical protein